MRRASGAALAALKDAPGVRDVLGLRQRAACAGRRRRASSARICRAFLAAKGLHADTHRADRAFARGRVRPARRRATREARRPPHEAPPPQGHRGQGDAADLARSAQPDDRAADAVHADVPARLWRQPRHQAPAGLHLRPRGAARTARPCSSVSRPRAISPSRAMCDELSAARSRPSTAAIAGWRSSSRPTSPSA